jgi:glucose/arabinose dehydrogenase
MARSITLCALALVAGLASSVSAQIRGETIVTGLRTPVAVVADPTDRSVLLIVEQSGLIRTARDGVLLGEPFLDLRNDISAGGERGLLGLALAPDYESSRRFYVNFTDRNGDTVIARFLRHAERPEIADRASRVDLQWPGGRRVVEQPFSNHNGGHLAFGPDGYLYIGLGDGGSGGDPMNHAQRPDTLLGKMLRIDVNVPDDDPHGYRVPPDNPFVDGDPIGALGEIWAFGLRNPWRYSFDDWTRGGTSALVIGDVGQNAREEINFEPRGGGGRNYGWRIREGRAAYDARTPPAYGPLAEPIHDYSRDLGASVTGGLIYRGNALDPIFNGRYVFADFISGRVFSIGLHLHPLTTEATADDAQEYTERLGGRASLGMVSSFGTDHDGEILLLNYSAGTVVRVVPDFSVVPQAPHLAANVVPDRDVELAWEVRAGGAAARSFAIERVRDGAVVDRQFVDQTSATVTWIAGDCIRVRAQSDGGTGPPSNAVCLQ